MNAYCSSHPWLVGLSHWLGVAGAAPILFMAGLLGGLTHCAGMCGPFVLAQVSADSATLNRPGLGEGRRLVRAFLLPYHLGRFTTYVGLGALVGGATGLAVFVSGYRWLPALLLGIAALVFLAQGLSGVLAPDRPGDRTRRQSAGGAAHPPGSALAGATRRLARLCPGRPARIPAVRPALGSARRGGGQRRTLARRDGHGRLRAGNGAQPGPGRPYRRVLWPPRASCRARHRYPAHAGQCGLSRIPGPAGPRLSRAIPPNPCSSANWHGRSTAA